MIETDTNSLKNIFPKITITKEGNKLKAIFRLTMLRVLLTEKIRKYIKLQNWLYNLINLRLLIISKLQKIIKPILLQEIMNKLKNYVFLDKFKTFEKIINKDITVILKQKDSSENILFQETLNFFKEYEVEIMNQIDISLYEVSGLDIKDCINFILEENSKKNMKEYIFDLDQQMYNIKEETREIYNNLLEGGIHIKCIANLMSILSFSKNESTFINYDKIKDLSYEEIGKLKISEIYELINKKEEFCPQWEEAIKKVKNLIINMDNKIIEESLNKYALDCIKIYESHLTKRQYLIENLEKIATKFILLEQYTLSKNDELSSSQSWTMIELNNKNIIVSMEEETKLEAIFHVVMLRVYSKEKLNDYTKNHNELYDIISEKFNFFQKAQKIFDKAALLINKELENMLKNKNFKNFLEGKKPTEIEEIFIQFENYEPKEANKMYENLSDIAGLDTKDWKKFIAKLFSHKDIRNHKDMRTRINQMIQYKTNLYDPEDIQKTNAIYYSIIENLVTFLCLKKDNFKFIKSEIIKDFSFENIKNLKMSDIYNFVHEKKAFEYAWYIKIEIIKQKIKNIDIGELKESLNKYTSSFSKVYQNSVTKRLELLEHMNKIIEDMKNISNDYIWLENIVEKCKL